MKKLGIAALVVAGVMGGTAPMANADGPTAAPCQRVSDLFATANVQMEPLPAPVGQAYSTVCKVTG
jgi:hypothetical protein